MFAADGPELTLEQAISVGLKTNPDIIAADRQLAAARTRVNQAIDQGHPTVSFNSMVSGSNADVGQPPPNSESFGTMQNSIVVPLPIGRKPHLAVVQASAQMDASAAQYAGVRTAVVNGIITAFYDLLRKQALLRDAEFVQSEAQRQLDEARLRNNAGDVPELDVLRSEIPVSTAQASVLQAQSDADIANQALNAALGRDLDTPFTAQDVGSLPDLSSVTEADVRLRAQQRATDVLVAKAKIAEEDAALVSSKLWREPQLSLQAIDARSGDVTGFYRLDSIQASVTIPLSDGGLGRDQGREAQAAGDQAKQQLASALLAASAVASASYRTAISARLQTDAAKQAMDIAQSAYDKVVIGYHNGLFPLTDVLSAQSALISTKSTYTQDFYNAQVASALLEVLIGSAVSPGGVR